MEADGIAFVGPGSEWFWIALQFAALATTFYAIYRQLQPQQTQIRDNTKVLRTQAHYNALLLAQRPFEMLIENESLAKVVNVGYATREALSDDDWSRCSYYTFMQFNSWEYLYYQNRDGSIPKELWVGADAYFRSLVATRPGLVRFWSEFEASFDEPFRSYVTAEFAGSQDHGHGTGGIGLAPRTASG
ncbi:MAG: hypothetical protein HYX54_05995 [Chloroflexi bacterium]|nr:hypothetical protein [Chloroflexota bacterium]